MADTRFDVVGIGNAIVDVLSHATDDFLCENDLVKGAMTLIDAERADELYDKMGAGIECSGGSAGNTIAALASLGASTAYIGKVRDDQLGRIFAHDMRSLGAAFDTPMSTDGTPTARCLIMVTLDAQRTMQTYLGACVELGPDDIDPETIADSKVTYMEGYLWDRPGAKQAFLKAAKIAKDKGRIVSLSLSDPFCVERHRDEFLELVKDHVDVLFANEDEIISLYQVGRFDTALQLIRKDCQIAALTRSDKGSVIVSGDEVHMIDAEFVSHVSDTTGAGDAYAAGFLYGLTRDMALGDCARIGGICAAEVVSHVGARPAASLAALIRERVG